MRNWILLIFLSSFIFSQLKIDGPAPSFFLRTIENENFFFSKEILKSDATVFSFFATWCEPCKKELPILDSIKVNYPQIKFYLVNVSGLSGNKDKLKEDPILVKEMLQSLKVDFPVLMDKYGVAAKNYGVKALPHLVIVSKEGTILYQHSGYVPGDEKNLIKFLTKLTNE